MGGGLWVPVASGPLAPYAAGYGSWLAARGYSRWTIGHRLWQLDLLSRWLERERLRPDELTPERVEAFWEARRAAGCSTWLSARSTALPLGYLRELGVVPAATAPVAVDDPLERLLAGYRRYLFDERGLTEHTVFARYQPTARLFLSGRLGPDGLGLGRLSGADVSLFLAAECPQRSVASARDVVSGLRSLLRFL
jgi:integrase/recombinase XerD